MGNYVIKRNKFKLFWMFLLLSGLALVSSAATIFILLTFDRANLKEWLYLLLYGAAAVVLALASIIFGAQLLVGKSELLRLTSEGFAYSGYGMGNKSYVASWKDVESIFYTVIETRGRYGYRGYERYISVDFKNPEVWAQQFVMNADKIELFQTLFSYSKRSFKNGELDISLRMSDHEKQIHEVVQLMRQCHDNAQR